MKIVALILDVFRQSRASAMFWVLLVLSLLAAAGLACIGYETGAPNPDGSGLWTPDQVVLFWSVRYPLPPDISPVQMSKSILAGLDNALIGLLGMVLMVVATGNFWPGFLNRGWVLVTLGKPISRPAIFAGRTLGAAAFVAFQASFFAAVTLLAVGLRTGHWVVGHLAVVPVTVAAFLIIYSISTLVGILSRSTVFAILAALGFWFLCSTVNGLELAFNADMLIQSASHGRVAPDDGLAPDEGAVRDESPFESEGMKRFRRIIHGVYLALPKIKDLDVAMGEAIQRLPPVGREPPRAARSAEEPVLHVDYATSLSTTAAALAVLYGLALLRFVRRDY